MSDDFLDDIGLGDRDSTAIVQDKRLDGRDPKQFMSNVKKCNKEEDHHVAHITQLNNSAGFDSISVAGLGAREKYFENPADIPNYGDHQWFFHGDDPFDVNVELKSRVGPGPAFRPKEHDVSVCIERNIPYLLVHNDKTDNASIILLRIEDLIYVRDNVLVITYEIKYGKPWNPYQEDKSLPVSEWKEYYKCAVYSPADRFEKRKMSYHDLKSNGTHDEWVKAVEYFRSVSGNQS